MEIRGYLIVELTPEAFKKSDAANPQYRGIDRMLAIRPDLLPADALDPMEFSNEHALIPDVLLAYGLVQELRKDDATPELELIHVQTGRWGPPEDTEARYEFAGYDVACEAPFWSTVADPPVDDAIRAFLRAHLNVHGLFQLQGDAQTFLELCHERVPDELQGLVLHNWEVRLVTFRDLNNLF